MHAAIDGKVITEWVPIAPEMPVLRLGVGFEAGGELAAVDADGDEVRVVLEEDFGRAFSVRLGDYSSGEIVVRSPSSFDIVTADGFTVSLRRGHGQYLQHLLCRPVTNTRNLGKKFRFGYDGSVSIEGKRYFVGEAFSAELSRGVRAFSDGYSKSVVVTGSICGVQCYRFLDRRGWWECFTEAREWSWGRVLNGESSDEVELFGTIKLYSNGNIEFAGTQALARFSEVEATHRDPSGRGYVHIARQQGSDILQIYEDTLSRPSSLAWYQPQTVTGKDGTTLYDAWHFAAANTTLPTGYEGSKPLRTAALLGLLLLFGSALFYRVAATICCGVFCMGIALLSLTRSFNLLVGRA